MVSAGSAELAATVAEVRRSVNESCSANTAKANSRCLRQFREFCKKHRRNCAAISSPDVILYLQSLKSKGLSWSTLLQQSSAISRAFLMAGKSDPTQSKVVSAILSAAKRVPREIRRAVPATVPHIKLLAARAKEMPGFTEQRAFVMSLVLLCACCRFKDLVGLKSGSRVFARLRQDPNL